MVQEVTKDMSQEAEQYHTVVQQKEMIVRRMKERGCRITKQRMILLDVILGSECS